MQRGMSAGGASQGKGPAPEQDDSLGVPGAEPNIGKEDLVMDHGWSDKTRRSALLGRKRGFHRPHPPLLALGFGVIRQVIRAGYGFRLETT